ncbi:MAG: hypothetical protein KGQ59_01140 [Bdellovibrionales bacterium]|nr:hypothetical protein [Bdellovibrionales bacterium]
MKTHFFAVLLGVSISTLAHAGAYSQIIQVEAGGLECAARAARVSALFASNASVRKLVNVECVNEFEAVGSFGPYRVYSIHVELDADDSFAVSTAEYGTGGLGSGAGSLVGAFSSLDLCLKSRPAEIAAFEQNSGISALFVSCLPERSQLQAGFVLSIVGFGRAKKQLQAFEYAHAYEAQGALSPNQMSWLNQELLALGASVRMNDGRSVLYYAENPITQALTSGGAFIETQQCTDQISEVQQILGQASVRGLVECRQYETRMRMEILTVGSDFSSSEVFGQKYSSYQVCMKYRSVVAARERQKDPEHFLGLVCSPDYVNSGFVHRKFATY